MGRKGVGVVGWREVEVVDGKGVGVVDGKGVGVVYGKEDWFLKKCSWSWRSWSDLWERSWIEGL